MSEELLYTQEDIGEWMSACNKLQVSLRELEDDIKAKDKQLAIYKRAFELAKLDGLEMDGYIVEAKKELEEQDVKN